MNVVRRALVACSLLLLSATLSAQQRYEAEIRQLESFIEQQMKQTGMPAISVAITKDGFTWAKGFGLADVENDVPAKAESSYRTASIAKPMTAVAIMRLVEQGKVDLDAEVQKYVPYFPKKQHPVTIRQLLGHLGGISHYRDYNAEGRIKEPKNTREAIAIFENFDLVAEPGTRYNYTSYGYNLLGAVIEGASGRSYGDFMREEVWKPLGMTATLLDDPRAIIPNRVRGYTMSNGRLRNSEYVDLSSRFAGGGARSTVVDLLKFLQGVGDGKIVKPETVDLMWTAQTTRNGMRTHYGLGFGATPQNGRFYVAHSGSQQETRTDMAYVPRARFAYALASNFEGANLAPIASQIAHLFLGDVWDVSVYAGPRMQQSRIDAIASAWNHGLAYYDRHGRAMTADARELAQAFRYFNETVDPKRLASVTGTDTMLSQGRHPAGGEAFIKAGSYMASELARSGANLEQYHHEGALAFFDDYVKLYRSSRARIPAARRLASATETAIAAARRDWERVWTDDVKRFALSGATDLDRFTREIAPRFASSSVIPNFGDAILETGETAATKGDMVTAGRAAEILLALYPELALSSGFAGVLAVASGDADRGRALLARSRSIDSSSYASNQNLEHLAGFLESQGNREAARVLREIR